MRRVKGLEREEPTSVLKAFVETFSRPGITSEQAMKETGLTKAGLQYWRERNGVFSAKVDSIKQNKRMELLLRVGVSKKEKNAFKGPWPERVRLRLRPEDVYASNPDIFV